MIDLIKEFERRGRVRDRTPSERRNRLAEARNTINIPNTQKKAWKQSTARREDEDSRRSLERALSESPSRERLLVTLHEDQYDGGGPYREREKVTDSMRVQDGSLGGRVRSLFHGREH